MFKIVVHFVLLIGVFYTSSTGVFAQQQQQSEEAGLLPDIDPQDIEIRGEFNARFPGLSRQPILGFNPKPPVYKIDPNRMPFMESPEEIVANIPVSVLSRPTPPSIKLMTFPRQQQLYSSFGFGRFSSPEGQLHGNYQLSENAGVMLSGNYQSSDGHFDTPQTSFRFFDAKADYFWHPAENKTVRISAGGLSDFNHTFDVGNAGFLPETPEKEYTGFNAGISYQTVENSFTGWKLNAGINIFNTDLLAQQLSGENDEQVYSLDISRRWAGRNLNEVFDVAISGKLANYDTQSTSDDNWSTLKGRIAYKRTLSFNTTLDLAAKAYFTDNEIEDSEFFILPDITVTQWFGDKLKATLVARGDVKARSNREHHNINRFLQTSNDIQHTRMLEAKLNLDYELKEGTILRGGFSYIDAEDHAFYLRPGIRGQANLGFYQAFYGDFSIIKGFAGFTHHLVPERFWFDITATLQNRDLESDDFSNLDEMPFTENFNTKATLYFDSGKSFKADVWANVASSSFSPQTTQDLDSYFLLGLRADYTFGKHLGVYIKGVNLLNESYQVWQGYEERPIEIYGGITVRL